MKSLSFRLFVTMLTITAVTMALLQLPACGTINAKELAKENRCPYEPAECPNVQDALAEHNVCVEDWNATYDSLTNVIEAYETVTAILINNGTIEDIKADSTLAKFVIVKGDEN